MTKDDVLALLEQADAPVSGEQMCKTLGLTRAAVWKAIEALRADGWPLEQGKLYTEKELAGMIAAACDAGSSENGAAWPSQAGSEGQVIE